MPCYVRTGRRMPNGVSVRDHMCVSRHPELGSRLLIRLDICMVDRGLAPSRARAQDLIRRGLVEVAGVIEKRPAAGVAAGAGIRVMGSAASEVSRGATKLAAALDHFRFAVAGVVALDVGASTGGFTQVLLAGAPRASMRSTSATASSTRALPATRGSCRSRAAMRAGSTAPSCRSRSGPSLPM